MVQADAVVKLLFSLSVAASLAVVAWFLYRSDPEDERARMLAALCLSLGLVLLHNFRFLTADPGPTADPRTNVWASMWGAGLFWRNLAIVGLFYVFPSRPRLRSWHTPLFVIVTGGILTSAFLWVIQSPLLIPGYGQDVFTTGGSTLWYFTARSDGVALTLSLVFLSSLVRVAQLQGTARRIGLVIAPLGIAWIFTGLGYEVYGAIAHGFGWEASTPGFALLWMQRGAVCCDPVIVAGAIWPVLLAASAVWIIARGPSVAVLGPIGFGLLSSVIPRSTGFEVYEINHLFLAIGILYTMGRYDAFGGTDGAGPGSRTVRSLASVLIGLSVMAFLLTREPTDRMFPVAVLAALLLAGMTILLFHPRFRAMIEGGLEDLFSGPDPLRIYQVALTTELSHGITTDQARSKLAPLRSELGVREQEHDVLAATIEARNADHHRNGLESGHLFLGRYRVISGLGEGSGGETCLCRDEALDRDVVIKALHPSQEAGSAPENVLREARALAVLEHPNVVTIHDVVQVGEQVFLVMEHVADGSLKRAMHSGPLDIQAFRTVAEDLLDALEAVHAAGTIHRDVKPANVLMTAQGRAKLADFGIAKVPGWETTIGASNGSVRGTIAYMSPEQARGEELTPASDLFSAAVTLYEAYTGHQLFEPRPGESPVELQVRVARWKGFRDQLDDPAMTDWFAKALAADPEDRFQSAVGMLEGQPRSPAGA